MNAEPEVLKALLGAESLGEFLSDYWPGRLFVARGDLQRLPPALLHEELNHFDSLSRRYKGVVSFFGDAKSAHMVPVEGVEAGAPYRCGLSVYLTDVGPYFPEVHRMVRDLERELGVNEGCARAGVFASPPGGGISCHYDSVDVISVQLRGTKKFDVAPVAGLRNPSGFQFVPGSRPIDDLYPQAGEGFPDWETTEFQTVEMTPGTVLYMPRGHWHRTESQDDSIAVSIGIEAPSAAECVLEQLRLLLLQDPEWRTPLYGAWGAGSMRAAAIEKGAALMATLPGLAASLDPEYLAMPKLSEQQRIAQTTVRSWVQRTPNSWLILTDPPADSVEEDSLLAQVEINDRSYKRIATEIEMPARCAPILRWIDEQRGSFQVSEVIAKFPELTAKQHVELIQSLAAGGLLKVLWFPKLN
jgi:ribosomal protein L16 Arg81 hydroxylase